MIRAARFVVLAGLLSACQAPEATLGQGSDTGTVSQAVNVGGGVSDVVSITATMNGTVLTVNTSEMPAGWFTRGGGFDAAKSPITLTWEVAASACLPAASGTVAGADGTFVPVLNPAGHPRGYSWTYSIDLAAYQNHWHNRVLCDGSTTVEGCSDPRTVQVTVHVGGSCVEPGCTATASASLPSVQDADVVDACECDIGACVSACQAACARGDKDCGTCCECRCKLEGRQRGNTACDPQPLCYSGSPGHAVCLAPNGI